MAEETDHIAVDAEESRERSEAALNEKKQTSESEEKSASAQSENGGDKFQRGKEQDAQKGKKSSEKDKTKQGKKQKKKKDQQAELQEKIDELNQQIKELKDKNLRGQAELDNFRRRAQKDQVSARENGKAAVLQELFQVYDHFQMAMQHTEENQDFETLKQGMNMILNEFQKAFENLGLKEINAEGEIFDPNHHEAVAQEPSSEVPEGRVVRQWKSGYLLGDRLLRPATVVVSSGSPASENESEGSSDTQNSNGS